MIISFAGHSSVSRGEKLCELVKEQIIKNARCDDPIAEESRTHTPYGEQFLRLSPNLVL